MKTFLSLAAILKCMRAVARVGTDPRNSSPAQLRAYRLERKPRRSLVEQPFTFGVDAPSYFQHQERKS